MTKLRFYCQDLLQRLKNKNKLSQFLVLISFLITFGIVRAITYGQKLGFIPNQDSALHIHHLVPGIFLILISGYIGISFWVNERLRLVMAVLFGIGAALTIDEFALWLYLQDVYWENQGRISVDLVIITATIFSLIFLFSQVHDHKWVKKMFKV